MPCFCLGAYNSNNTVRFVCGHIVHAECASRHIAVRLGNESDPSCPMCNNPGEAQGPAILDIGEEDVEQFDQ